MMIYYNVITMWICYVFFSNTVMVVAIIFLKIYGKGYKAFSLLSITICTNMTHQDDGNKFKCNC